MATLSLLNLQSMRGDLYQAVPKILLWIPAELAGIFRSWLSW